MAKLAVWVSRALVIAIGYIAAIIALRYVPVDHRPVASSDTAPQQEIIDAVGIPSIDEIARDAARQSIFGIAGSKPVKQITREVAPQITKLNLSLIGVYSAQPMDRAIAIISSNGKPEEVYRIGDTIIGRAKLLEVLPTEIVIDNAGRREIVKLPEKVASTGRATGIENLPGASVPNTGQPQSGSNDGGSIQLPDSPGEIRNLLAKNPAMLNRLVSAVPYRENGRILGYRLTPKQSSGLLETNGILPGDVVTRVNGIALANQKNGIRALRKLVKAATVDLTILRDGVELPINISLE